MRKRPVDLCASTAFNIFPQFVWQDLELMAMEQDRESDKQIIISQVEGHRKQMLR